MRRSAKLCLYGTALAGIAAGTIAWTNLDKTVTVDIDGTTRSVHTASGDVEGALHDAGLQVGSHDLVAPAASSSIHNGSRIVLRRGRLLQLNVDGAKRDVWVTAPTVEAALSQLGYGSNDLASVSRSTRLPLGPTPLTIRTPRQVTVRHDGKSVAVSTTASNVSQLLNELELNLGQHDQLSAPRTSALHSGETIVVRRVRQTQVRSTQPIPYPTTKKLDPQQPWGQTSVVTPGKAGSRTLVYDVTYIDGKAAKRTLVSNTLTTPPTTAVVTVGSAASTPDQARAAARGMLASFGWGDDQFSCLDSLWTKESNWRVNAENSDGGAYGIPQSLPGSKMASAGPDWQTNAVTQISWGLGYISRTYGTPCAAWSHSEAMNWY